jgi:N6-adenosine-specific RNA methylase IME4
MKLDRDLLRKLPLALRIEIEENSERKSLTQSELAHQQQRIVEELRKHTTPGKRTDLKDGNATSEKGFSEVRATAVVGKLYGESHKQVEKRLQIVEVAEAEPEKYGEYLKAMDRTGTVDGPYKRLKVARRAETIRKESPPLPGNGPYRVGVVDLPWPYEAHKQDPSRHPAHPYPEMTIEQICAVPVGEHMTEDAILRLWVTNFHIWFAPRVLESWGFTPRTILTWGKTQMTTGDWLRGQTEHAVLAVRGKPPVQLVAQTTLLLAPRRGPNSRKPDEFYRLVEEPCPAPRYVEFFAREARPRWDGFGDECLRPIATGRGARP